MHVKSHVFFIIFLCSTISSLQCYQCQKTKHREMSRTKCVAGRRFYARFDRMQISKMLPEKYLLQPYVYPWIAEIVALYAGKSITCTGTLINDRYIITAQHCVSPPLEAQHLTVSLGYQLGVSDPNQFVESSSPSKIQKEVLDIILHPRYDYTDIRTASNDLALLKMSPVSYSKTIYPIQLPSVADKYYDLSNTIAENVGWEHPIYGNPQTGHSFSNTFHKMAVQVINNQDCSNFNVYYKHAINPEVLCTVNVGKINVGPCNGDTGAPLMVENNKRVYNVTILVGIVSWSAPKHKPCIWYGSPVVYVRIDNKLQWIMDHTKDALYCRY